jgi:amino acid permease
MILEGYLLIGLAGITVIGSLYFLIAKKREGLKLFFAAIAGFTLSLVLSFINSKSKFKKDAKVIIENSEKEDKDREDVISSADKQIEKNKELLNEIKNILGG